MKLSKNDIRESFKNIRNNISSQEVCESSRKIFKRLLELDVFNKANVVMCYSSFNNEVQTDDIIKFCIEEGKCIALPCLINENDSKSIVPLRVNAIDGLKMNCYNIKEPIFGEGEIIEINDISIVLVPGIAFDVNGNRIGFGKGYYDRFLAKLNENTVKIGLAYEYQVIDFIPVEEYDICLDIIITNERIIKINKL